MVPVTSPQGVRGGTTGPRSHLVCGVVGLGVVFAVFLAAYPAIAGFVEETFGLLSSTSIIWLFITTWLVLWIGMEMALAGWAERRA